MIPETHEFYYEDFINDISKYLKYQEREFLITSFDGLSTHVDVDKLAKKLSDFWLNMYD